MNLIKFHPLNAFSGFGRLPELKDELDRFFSHPSATSPRNSWAPALDVYEEKDSYVVKVELPGLSKEDVKLSLEQGTLSITGERKVPAKSEHTEVYYSERSYGQFQRTVNLPASVAADKVSAQYQDGILTVTLPKSEEAKPRQINISHN